MFNRTIKKAIEASLLEDKITVIYGARQVGKTTLVKEIMQPWGENAKYINCDQLHNREGLATQNFQKLSDFIGAYDLVVIDEAQRVENIGLNLKILYEGNPNLKIIATGSSSFELSNKINEPLTGRKNTFMLFPLSVQEILSSKERMIPEEMLNKIIVYGSYPEIYPLDNEKAGKRLKEIVNDYLYKDILVLENIKKSAVIIDLLRLIAFQVGNEVSYQELANKLGIHVYTVEKYITLLEQSFVIFRLSAFSTNLRNEIKKKDKIYFRDLGIRNTLIANLNPIHVRNDIGALWENFCISERQKRNVYQQNNVNAFFWRSYQQQEIDYIEEQGGTLNLFEYKRSANKKSKIPSQFTPAFENTHYTLGTYEMITKENIYTFLCL